MVVAKSPATIILKAQQKEVIMAKKPSKAAAIAAAEYFAQSNTAIDGVHFLAGAPIFGVTDRDQIALALRLKVIGTEPPVAAPAPAIDDGTDDEGSDDDGTDDPSDDAAEESAGDDTGDRDAD